jgi:hypothetical protein
MLQNAPFYWGSIRKITESFGAVFSDLHFIRMNEDGSAYQTIEVPCEYGLKEKWYIRNVQNPMPGQNDQVEMVLPRMGYQLTGFQYDSSRKLTSTGRTVQAITGNNRVLKAQYNPVPFNISFDLSIAAKSVEDGFQIIEQIVPFFTPDYTIHVNDMPTLNLEKDINLVYTGNIDYQDNAEGQFDRRVITWTLGFVAKAYIYPPVNITTVNLETRIRFNVDGGSATPGASLPQQTTVAFPPATDAIGVSDGTVTTSSTTVLVLVTPSAATLRGGQSQIFQVTIVNASNIAFTVNVPTTTQTGNDTYSIDPVHNTFTYTAGTGVRTSQETITISFISVQDSTQNNYATLVLNP